MTSTVTDRFDIARANEPQLNQRQREVLDLLVAGKTNGEIGETLGMTLDGAKWNVGEILGKLGLESREQAAEYWRWRARRTNRVPAMRGLLGLGSLKWVAGTAAVAVVGLTLLGLLSTNDDTKPGELPPFYLEASIQITDRSRSIGTNIAGSGDLGFAEERSSMLKWWNKDPERMRWEIENTQDFDVERTVIVADGKQQWQYRESTNTYASEDITPAPDGFRVSPIGLSVFIGPAYTGDAQQYLDGLKDWGGDGAELKRVGTEILLGRPTVIYEFSPASKSSTSGRDSAGNLLEETTDSGSGRIWLDEERVVVMRYVSTTPASDVRAEVTRFDYDTKLDASKLRFDRPAGSVEGDFSGDSGDSSSGSTIGLGESLEVPEGFLAVDPQPAGLEPVSWEREQDGDGQLVAFSVILSTSAGAKDVSVEQRLAPNGLSSQMTKGERRTVAGTDAYVVLSGERTRIVTLRDGLAVIIIGPTASEPELFAIAESLQPAP